MAILESVRELASKLGAETNGRDITDQINKINKHLDETALGGRDIASAVRTYSENASGGGVEFSASPAAFMLLQNIRNLKVTIPDGVTSIANGAFSNCTGLIEVEIPNGVTSIGEYAFSGCTGLTEIKIPTTVTTLDNAAFSGCTGLTEVEIPDGVTTLAYSVFSGCTGLTEIEIPNGVTSIGNGTFYKCTGLTQITINKSEGSITGAPWGAPNATVIWNG